MQKIPITYNNVAMQNYNPQKAVDSANEVVGTFICAVNELCDYHLSDSFNLLQKSRFFRQKVKHDARLAREAMRSTITYATDHLRNGKSEQYYNYVDKYSELIKHDVDVLYYSIAQALTKKDVPDRVLIASMETTRILLMLALQAYDELMDDVRKLYAFDTSTIYSGYRPTGAWHFWCTAFDAVLEQVRGIGVNLNEEPNVVNAYKVIQKRFVNGEFINEACVYLKGEIEKEKKEQDEQ